MESGEKREFWVFGIIEEEENAIVETNMITTTLAANSIPTRALVPAT